MYWYNPEQNNSLYSTFLFISTNTKKIHILSFLYIGHLITCKYGENWFCETCFTKIIKRNVNRS